MSYLQSISLFEGDNVSGLLEISIALKKDIATMADPIDGIISDAIVFEDGKSFVVWEVVPQDAEVNGKAVDSMEGFSEKTDIRFRVPKDRPDIKNMFDQAVDDEFIVVVKDGNGQQMIIGNLDSPVRFRYGFGTGTESGRNSYTGTLFSDSIDNRAFYLATVQVPPVTGQPVTIRLGAVDGPVLGTAQPGSTFVVTSGFKTGAFQIS